MSEPLKKGQLILVKAAPYYQKSYFYEILSAGQKQVRAGLYHSPKVKKSWSLEEFDILIKMGMIRLALPDERPEPEKTAD